MRRAWSPAWQLPNLPSSSAMPPWDCPELAGEMGFGTAAAVTSHPARLGNSVQCPVLAGAAEQPPAPGRAHPAPGPGRITLSCTQIHRGKDTLQGKEGDTFLGKPPHLPGLELRALQGWLLQHRTEAVGGCLSLPVPACPQLAPSTIRYKHPHL